MQNNTCLNICTVTSFVVNMLKYMKIYIQVKKCPLKYKYSKYKLKLQVTMVGMRDFYESSKLIRKGCI